MSLCLALLPHTERHAHMQMGTYIRSPLDSLLPTLDPIQLYIFQTLLITMYSIIRSKKLFTTNSLNVLCLVFSIKALLIHCQRSTLSSDKESTEVLMGCATQVTEFVRPTVRSSSFNTSHSHYKQAHGTISQFKLISTEIK